MPGAELQLESKGGAPKVRPCRRHGRWVLPTLVLAAFAAAAQPARNGSFEHAALATVFDEEGATQAASAESWWRRLEEGAVLFGLADAGGQPLGRRAADSGSLDADSAAYRTTRRLLPEFFVDYETKRFVVLSDASPQWTRAQCELLERTYHQFHRYARRIGVEPRPLRHKLVCVLFEEHQDYQVFARANDGVTAEWISGYYSPKADRVVFYNIETNPAFAASASALQGSRGASGVAATRIAEDYAKASIATTVHEAIHQLAFHTRIQSPHVENPLWISEGLATSFETDRTGEAFGPDRAYAPRQQQFRKLLAEDKLIPLRELVTWTQMPDHEDDTITAVYHQSYALVTWMSRFRSDELRDYLVAMSNEQGGRPTPQRHLRIFEEAFGNVDRLERVWLRYERESKQ